VRCVAVGNLRDVTEPGILQVLQKRPEETRSRFALAIVANAVNL
jgi:hypothetical protein